MLGGLVSLIEVKIYEFGVVTIRFTSQIQGEIEKLSNPEIEDACKYQLFYYGDDLTLMKKLRYIGNTQYLKKNNEILSPSPKSSLLNG